jgi:hypothetical protein
MWGQAALPHVGRHVGPTGQPLLRMLVSYRLLGRIYAIFQVGLIRGLTLHPSAYISSPVPPPWSYP